nr:MAG TPA: hypothetical protein [Caudoviricetes sp.]
MTCINYNNGYFKPIYITVYYTLYLVFTDNNHIT